MSEFFIELPDTGGKHIYDKFYLSTTPYYFSYRMDHYDPTKERATLFDDKANIIDDVSVSEKSHTDIINYFESRLTLKTIPNPSLEPHYREVKRRGMWIIPKEI